MADHMNHHHHHGHEHGSDKRQPGADTVLDPVCGMEIEISAETKRAEFHDQEYFFCSDSCQIKFETDPWFFASGNAEKVGQQVQPGAQWTCPMHPEVIRDEPGACPICGMALEPMTPSADSGPNPELVDFRRRLWIGAPFAAAVFILEMGSHVGAPFATWLGAETYVWIQFLLAIPVVLIMRKGFESGFLRYELAAILVAAVAALYSNGWGLKLEHTLIGLPPLILFGLGLRRAIVSTRCRSSSLIAEQGQAACAPAE